MPAGPADPIERMMIEQIALAHHKIGELYFRARRANSPEKVKVYHAAITALLGEFRRMALALKSYREPTPAKHVTVVRQQNLAQSQQVAYLDGERPSATAASNQQPENRSDSKLGSKKAIEHVSGNSFPSKRQAPRHRREKEPAAAKRPDAEGRKRLRQAALTNQPWRFSSGPKTTRGKASSAANGKKRKRGNSPSAS